MNAYEQILNEFSSNAYLLYSTTVSQNDWGDKEAGLKYLKKYFLHEEEYLEKWKPVQDVIFQNGQTGLPAKVIRDGFLTMPIQGGILFEKADYEAIQHCTKSVGDKFLIIIQNDFGGLVTKPILRMKYPIDTPWSELMSGNFISTVLFEMFANEYFVFSESGSWGKYSANDYVHPLEIIAFRPEYAPLFMKQFDGEEQNRHEIIGW